MALTGRTIQQTHDKRQKVSLYFYCSCGRGDVNSLRPLLLLLVLLGESVEHVGEGLLLLGALGADQLRARGHPLLGRRVLRVELHALEGGINSHKTFDDGEEEGIQRCCK